jgi:hypothetical protein
MNLPEDCDTCCSERFHCAWSAANEDLKTPIVMCPVMRDQTGWLLAPCNNAGIIRAKFKEVFG